MGTSQKKSARGSASTVVTYFCAQLEGEQTKQKLHTDTNKRRGRTCMDRFACDGWLFITIVHNNNTRIRVRMTHSEAHVHYTDIAISEKIQNIIIEMKNSTSISGESIVPVIRNSWLTQLQKIWDRILREYGTTELTEKQVYDHWQSLNQDVWKLDNDQVKSAVLVLEAEAGTTVERIPIVEESGISTIAFAFKEVVDAYGDRTEEVAMDSTCTSAQIFAMSLQD